VQIPVLPPPRDATIGIAEQEHGPAESIQFQQAFEECVTSNDHSVIVSSFCILRKLILNATTKGQGEGEESSKFRKVRLSNAKIRAAITDVHGALDMMMACGFSIWLTRTESHTWYTLQLTRVLFGYLVLCTKCINMSSRHNGSNDKAV
jgi:hypothetical protein